MGNYASNQELIDRFESVEEAGKATNAENILVPDQDVLTEVIQSTESEMDSYLGQRISTPVDTSEASRASFLKGMTLDIAQYYLGGGRSDKVSEVKIKIYENRIAWLKMAAKGEVTLPGTETPAPTTSRTPTSRWGVAGTRSATGQRQFTRETQANL